MEDELQSAAAAVAGGNLGAADRAIELGRLLHPDRAWAQVPDMKQTLVGFGVATATGVAGMFTGGLAFGALRSYGLLASGVGAGVVGDLTTQIADNGVSLASGGRYGRSGINGTEVLVSAGISALPGAAVALRQRFGGLVNAEGIELTGAAARSRFAEYAVNPNGATRTIEEARALARSRGIDIPEDVNIQFDTRPWTRADADAEYLNASSRYPNPNAVVKWNDFYHKGTGMIPVRLNPAIANSDEAIVANIGHEMHELNALRDTFEDVGGQMTAGQLARQINTRWTGGSANNLHEQAWDAADRLVFLMRKEIGQ